VDAIVKALKKADALYLATDPDREGEAISWHLYELLRERGKLKDKTVQRVVFHEITKRAIQEAIENARDLSSDLVNAQQARRALDYLVGFNLSPAAVEEDAPRPVRRPGAEPGPAHDRRARGRDRGLQAARILDHRGRPGEGQAGFHAKLSHLHGEKLSQFSVTDGKKAGEVEQDLTAAAKGELACRQGGEEAAQAQPGAPFTTSTLQQEASRKLGFTAQRTMRVAQQLYEGLDIGGRPWASSPTCVPTRVNLAHEARGGDSRRHRRTLRQATMCRMSPRNYKTKAKNAQEAHEAIRPTSAARPGGHEGPPHRRTDSAL
jgi:DNA topoisomerase I